MPLEIFSFIPQLVATNPLGTDPKALGDDHIRGIKETLQNQFPAFTGEAVVRTEAELNAQFEQFLQGYADTGLHQGFGGDVDTIDSNSMFYVLAAATNVPADFSGTQGGFIRTDHFTLDNQNSTQVLYGMHVGNQYKIWQRSQNSGVWDEWKLTVDNGVFNTRYAGFQDDGFSEPYISDLDAIIFQAQYHIRGSTVTNEPPDLGDDWGVITVGTLVSGGDVVQTIRGVTGAARKKTWQRHRAASVWNSWVLLVNGNSANIAWASFTAAGNFIASDGFLSMVRLSEGTYTMELEQPLSIFTQAIVQITCESSIRLGGAKINSATNINIFIADVTTGLVAEDNTVQVTVTGRP